MTTVEKALLTKELSKASTALQHAFAIARASGRRDLANSFQRHQVEIAGQITALNGGPVSLTPPELLGAFR
jgi:hypothetical protein